MSAEPIVFVKDMAHRFRQHLKKGTVDSVLPEGYIHTFLIRDPRETVPRQYNVLKRGYRQGSGTCSVLGPRSPGLGEDAFSRVLTRLFPLLPSAACRFGMLI